MRAAGIDELALLATSVHIVELVSSVFVLTVTAIELISLPIIERGKKIVAILALVSEHRVATVVTVEYILLLSRPREALLSMRSLPGPP